MTPQESTFGSGWDSKSAEEHSFSFPEGQFSLWKRANAVSNCEACVHTGATQAEWTRLLLCTGGKPRLRLLAEQTRQQRNEGDADEGNAAASHELLHVLTLMSRIVTGDGIDITSSQDVEVKNCFIRSTDDSICIKSQGMFRDPSTVRDVTKVRVHNNVIWNAEPGNAIELGYALQSEIHDLVFEDCDIIHCQYEGNMGGAAISIHQADGGHVHDIHYKNIRVEQAEQKLFDIKVLLCKYTQQLAKGEINDIYFDNIQVLNGDIPVSMIRGYQTPTEEVRVHDVHFDNITFMGNKCETWQDLRLVTELANDIYVNGARICRQMKF